MIDQNIDGSGWIAGQNVGDGHGTLNHDQGMTGAGYSLFYGHMHSKGDGEGDGDGVTYAAGLIYTQNNLLLRR